MAVAHCILGKFLGVVCHCFPPPLDVPTFTARCLYVGNDARDPSSERWNCGRERFRPFCINSNFHVNLGIFYIILCHPSTLQSYRCSRLCFSLYFLTKAGILNLYCALGPFESVGSYGPLLREMYLNTHNKTHGCRIYYLCITASIMDRINPLAPELFLLILAHLCIKCE